MTTSNKLLLGLLIGILILITIILGVFRSPEPGAAPNKKVDVAIEIKKKQK